MLSRLIVRIGPVPRARRVVDLPDHHHIAEPFESFLAQWTELADGDVFEWSADVDPTRVRALAAGWFNLAKTTRERGAELGLVNPPLQAEQFYNALLVAMATALTAADNEDKSDKFSEVAPACAESRHAVPKARRSVSWLSTTPKTSGCSSDSRSITTLVSMSWARRAAGRRRSSCAARAVPTWCCSTACCPGWAGSTRFR